jgi:serine/threonine protein phosphatase PrpC
MLRLIVQQIRDLFTHRQAQQVGEVGKGADGRYGVEEINRRRLVTPTDNVCAISDVGLVRHHNEDRFYITEDGQVLVFADGMGGHQAGEVASALAIETAAANFTAERRLELASTAEPIEALLLDMFTVAHRNVLQASHVQEGYHRIGPTMILA